ncbi:MAG: LAGLIDADG family homing endonuclease [bacterium]|nr:LAGLIDADG family homing endonuclease [bacterium]
MPSNWAKGMTKETHPSIRKRADTMRTRKIDNFAKWRNMMKATGKIRSVYPLFKKDGDLAELIGVVLGDGHIRRFPRTEELSIFSNSNNPGFISRYARLMERIFDKKPALTKHQGNCTRIRLYQKEVHSRLGVPYSPRGKLHIRVPRWILNNEKYIVRYLRGLYEAEGSHCVHLPTGTYKLFFSNRNQSMLNNVFRLLRKLGFHPHKSKNHYNVQLSKKVEVFKAIKLLQFRKY